MKAHSYVAHELRPMPAPIIQSGDRNSLQYKTCSSLRHQQLQKALAQISDLC